MLRYSFAVVIFAALFALNPEDANAQASKRLKQNQTANPQKESWDQVDKINRGAEGSRSRNEQARKAGKLDEKKYTGGTITKRHVLPTAPKSTAKKQKSPPRQK